MWRVGDESGGFVSARYSFRPGAPAFMYFQLCGLPSAIHSIAVSRRLVRVASVFASVIHSMYSRLLLGLNLSNVLSFGALAKGLCELGGHQRLFSSLCGSRGLFSPASLERAASLQARLEPCPWASRTAQRFYEVSHRFGIARKQDGTLPKSECTVILECRHAARIPLYIEMRNTPFEGLLESGATRMSSLRR